MTIKFPKMSNKGRMKMSTALQNLTGKTPTEILAYGDANNITTDIFSIAEALGVNVVTIDFSEIEHEAKVEQGTILGAIIDNDDLDQLTIFLKDELSSSDYYKSKTAGEKIDILRRRQRFTVAHEIAHACRHLGNQEVKLRIDYHKNADEYIQDERHDEVEHLHEFEANVFAGELLMPFNLILTVSGQLIKPSAEAFSKIFDVSKTVVRERLKYLGMLKLIEGAE